MTIRIASAVVFCITGLIFTAHAVDIMVNASAGRIAISPAIYGRDNCLSDDPSSPTPAATLTPALAAIWYATHLGTFADNGVALFSPWNWYKGQWEVMHLFSRYAKPTRVQSASTLDSMVSAYSSVNGAGDSVTVILVNRDKAQAQQARIQTSGFTMGNGPFDVLELANLNATNETFQSHTVNALARRSVTPAAGVVTLTLPAYSVTAVLLSGRGASVLHPDIKPENRTKSKKKTGMMYNLDGRRIRPTATKHSFEDASGVKVSNGAQLFETTVVK